MKNKKKPRTTFSPNIEKKPRVAFNLSPEGIYEKVPTWRFKLLDYDGPFGWKSVSASELESIIDKLKQFETMKWKEIDKIGDHHSIPTSDICQDAKNRLIKLNYNDYDPLYSFRIMGKPRLWGFRENDAFYILWWDPKHLICPAPKKHT